MAPASSSAAKKAALAGLAAIAVGGGVLWAQVPPPRPKEVYLAALQPGAQSAEREAIAAAVVKRSQELAADVASRIGSVALAKEPFDIVVSGGGFRGQYAGGVLAVLQILEQQGLVTISRWAGSSIGACTAAHFAAGNTFESFFRVPWAWQAMWEPAAFWRGLSVVKEMIQHSLHPDALARVSGGRLSVTVAEFGWVPRPWRSLLFFSRHDVDQFSNREDLIDTLATSASIPGFTGGGSGFGFNWWRGGWSADGGIVCNVPVFTDNARPQLVINLGFLDYPHLYTFSPLDPEHHLIVLEGMEDLHHFLLHPVATADCDIGDVGPEQLGTAEGAAPALVGGSGYQHRLSCGSLGGSLMILHPDKAAAAREQATEDSRSRFHFRQFYKGEHALSCSLLSLSLARALRVVVRRHVSHCLAFALRGRTPKHLFLKK
jgi:hypothetical protein